MPLAAIESPRSLSLLKIDLIRTSRINSHMREGEPVDETPRYEVRSLSELAGRYGFTSPNGVVGKDRVLDYGEPIVLADSYQPKESSRFTRFIGRILRLPAPGN